MSKLADLKGALARVDALMERAEALRPGLAAEATEGLDIVKNNTTLMREELDALLASKPDVIPDPNAGVSEAAQAVLDRTVGMLTGLARILEAWLEEWDA